MTTLEESAGTTQNQTQATEPKAPQAFSPPRTTIPDRAMPHGAQARRRIGGIRTTDVLSLVGSIAASLTTTGLLWTELSPFTGALGYVVTSWILFIVYYAILVSFDENRPTMWERLSSAVLHSLAVVLVAALVLVICYTFLRAWPALPHLNFYTQDLLRTGPLDPLTSGGVLHAMVGTLIEIGITLGIAVPLGLLGAVFLHEVPGPFSRFVRTVVEAMTALPDIVAGLFVYATLILILGLGFSGFAASVALAVTILPIIIRAGDVVLRLVPGGLTEASYALGAGQWRTVRHILLPTARSGLATAVILGAARAIGETSPVLLTAGFTPSMNVNPINGPMVSLPLEAFEAVQSPVPNMIARGFGAAAVLLVLVLVLFAIARVLGGRGAGQLSPGQRRRRNVASKRDLARFTNRHPDEAADGPGFGYGYAFQGDVSP
jgi:phosphate transport system permease protein